MRQCSSPWRPCAAAQVLLTALGVWIVTGCAHEEGRGQPDQRADPGIDRAWASLGREMRTSWHLPPGDFFNEWGIEIPGLDAIRIAV